MKQKLTHWVNKGYKDLTIKGKGKFKGRDRKFEIKPVGFWISVDGSWERWLSGNWEDWLKGKVCLEVDLAEDIKLFVIKTKQQFLDKYRELTGKTLLGDKDSKIDEKQVLSMFDFHDFHQKLKEHYDGMMLLEDPFYKHRLDGRFMYFYGWDCESICIWNKDKIKFKEVKK